MKHNHNRKHIHNRNHNRTYSGKPSSLISMALLTAIIALLVCASPAAVKAQPGPSFSFSTDFLPYQDFKSPLINDITGVDTTYFVDPQTKLLRQSATITYPLVFSEGRTVVSNELSYQLIEFRYRNFNDTLDKLHSASYSLMVQHVLSEKWTFLGLVKPSLASDLQAEVSKEDFSFQAASILIRKYSERFSLGLGAVYSTQFGNGVPLPVIAIDWNNGNNLMIKAFLPASLEFWYRPSKTLDLGLLVSGDGDNYHGDPSIHGVANPELRYTMLTIGPAAKITVAKNVKLNVEAGIIGLHQFNFYNGDTEIGTFELEPSQYVRVGFEIGG